MSSVHTRNLGQHLEGPHVVITGNPVDGLFFYGPFTLHEDAVEWATAECSEDNWWVAPLVSEETYRKELAS